MIARMFEPSNYAFSIYAVPTFLTTAAILLLGLVVLVRERKSPVSLSFFLLTSMVSIWLFGFSWAYLSTNEETALLWTRFAYLGVPFIAPGTYQFTVSMLRLGEGYKWLARAGWAFAAFFSYAALFTDSLTGGMYLYPWGYYAHFGPMGVPFLVFFFGMLLMSMVNYWIEYKKAPYGTHKLRVQWMMTAFGVGYVGSIDYVAVFGIPLYPCGYAAILGFLVVSARAIWKYHLVDITPAFAANEIVQTMTDALLVFDQEGVVRVANPAASRLFGYTPQEIVGKPITATLSDQDFAHRLADLVSSGGADSCEMEYLPDESVAEKRTLNVSTSTMDDKSGRQVAVLCIAHDITERKRSEKRMQRQVERLAALRSIDAAITSGHRLHVNLDVILRHVTEQLRIDAASILLLNPHIQVLEYGAGLGFRTNAINRSRVSLGEGFAGRAALERRALYVPDMSGGQLADPLSELQLRINGDESPVVRPLFTVEEIVAYYALPLIAKGEVKGVLEIFNRSRLEPTAEWVDFAEALAGQAAIAIDNARLFQELQRSNMELRLAYDTTLQGWSQALDLRDEETEGHTRRVTALTERLARAMGQREAEIVHIRRGALLHDIGKMGIPDAILLKPGPLTEEEWEIMRKHPVYAYELLSPIVFLRPALDIPYCHHEKWDGTGYPRGLKGEQIPLAARIFAVVDVWDALRSDRPYRRAWPPDKVRQHILSLAGTHFDPDVVEAFLKTESEVSAPLSPLELSLNITASLTKQDSQEKESLS